MDKLDLGISKNDIKFLLELIRKSGKLSELEYEMALVKLEAYKIT